MPTLTMLKGLPASGKSTWAKQQDAFRVNKDEIRLTYGDEPWSKEQEKRTLNTRDGLIRDALRAGLDVISDDTNLGPFHEPDLKAIADEFGARFVVDDSFLNIPIDMCIARDRLRVGKARVGEKVIREMAEKFLNPANLIIRTGNPQLFLDLDGVLADFDSLIAKEFGFERTRNEPEPKDFWDTLRTYKGRLYYDLKPLPYATRLYDALKVYKPIILTGTPWSIPTAADDKREWVARYIDKEAKVQCCKSKNKYKYGKPGDILVDDWAKYQGFWEEMGGTFILHTDPDDSIRRVREILEVNHEAKEV